MLCGLGALLSLPTLLVHAGSPLPAPAAGLTLPIGPPGMALQLALDPLAALFLLTVFACGTLVTAFGGGERRGAALLCIAGVALAVLAGDVVTLVLGMTLAGGALWHPHAAARHPAGVLPVLLLAAGACLLAPADIPAPLATAGPGRAAIGALLLLVGCVGVLAIRTGSDAADTLPPRQALLAGAVFPALLYLLLRFLLSVPSGPGQAGWGFVLLLAGSAVALAAAWQAAQDLHLAGAVAALARRPFGMALIGFGLILIARSADLPEAAAYGLAAILLLALTSGLAGTLGCLAAQSLADGAGTSRLNRLGGLIHTMPAASLGLGAALLSLSALPPGAGFAGLWLLFQSLLTAPRTGGLISQLPLALVAAVLAVSAALSSAAAVRIGGIALLSRPRSVRGSAARDIPRRGRLVMVIGAALTLLVGILPGLILRRLMDAAMVSLVGTGLTGRTGWMTLAAPAGSPGYSSLPVLALLGLAGGSIIFLVRRLQPAARLVAPWNDGIPASPDLPFGEPMAQSAGAGFLPPLPLPRPLWPQRVWPTPRRPDISAISRRSIGLWALLIAFAALLLVLSLFETGGSPA